MSIFVQKIQHVYIGSLINLLRQHIHVGWNYLKFFLTVQFVINIFCTDHLTPFIQYFKLSKDTTIELKTFAEFELTVRAVNNQALHLIYSIYSWLETVSKHIIKGDCFLIHFIKKCKSEQEKLQKTTINFLSQELGPTLQPWAKHLRATQQEEKLRGRKILITTVFSGGVCHPESEGFIEEQAFLRSCDSAPLPTPPSLSRQQVVSVFAVFLYVLARGRILGPHWDKNLKNLKSFPPCYSQSLC